MSDYIKRSDALNFDLEIECEPDDLQPMMEGMVRVMDYIKQVPAADVVEVDDVARMLAWLFADYCPCNYNSIDEWLPYVCELSSECPSPKDPLGCWKQFIKHHKAKMDGGADG